MRGREREVEVEVEPGVLAVACGVACGGDYGTHELQGLAAPHVPRVLRRWKLRYTVPLCACAARGERVYRTVPCSTLPPPGFTVTSVFFSIKLLSYVSIAQPTNAAAVSEADERAPWAPVEAWHDPWHDHEQKGVAKELRNVSTRDAGFRPPPGTRNLEPGTQPRGNLYAS